MEAKKDFDEWKEKERAKLYGEIDKLKKLFWDEFKTVANHNSTLEEVPNMKAFSMFFGENLLICSHNSVLSLYWFYFICHWELICYEARY